MGNLSFGDALAPGEIAVRGYVSEASGDKRLPRSSPLGLPVFEREPAARQEVLRGAINKSEQSGKAVAPGRERAPRFVIQPIGGECRIVAGDVGRVAEQRVEAPA